VNPCPCGWYGDTLKECTCSTTQVLRYQKRISGPLLDRIDIHIVVPRVEYEKLAGDRLGEPSERIRARVERAREIQRGRFRARENGGSPKLLVNADMGPAEVREYCDLDESGKQLIRAAMKQMSLSARAYHRILKLARTIADLADCAQIETPHLAEAIQYRPRGQA
jgi:magnesium chelatase family protein